MAIGFNDFLGNPEIPLSYLIPFSLVAGLIVAGILGGSRKRFFMVFGGVSLGFGVLLQILSLTHWFIQPGIGMVGVTVFAFGFAIIVTQLSTGLDNRKSLSAALIAASVVAVTYYPAQVLMGKDANFLSILGVFLITCGLSAVAGYLVSGIDRRINIRTAILTAVLGTFPLIVDRFMQEFGTYMQSDAINYRPVPTIGQANDLLSEEQLGSFWINGLDSIMHLILPTVALTLISFAGYVRFSRGSLLEVLNMDYIRTARAKGLTERTVVVRHAMRNAMLPLTTILVNDFAGVLGGAIITDQVELKGSLAFDGNLEFNGHFEGEIISSGTLLIGPDAILKGDIEAIYKNIETKVTELHKGQDEQIASLVRIYEKMKPESAASILNNLDLTILLDVVRGMKEAKLAPVLAKMDVKKATFVTAALAEKTPVPEDAKTLMTSMNDPKAKP
jgi:peptide/nickel transport system permease protein